MQNFHEGETCIIASQHFNMYPPLTWLSWQSGSNSPLFRTKANLYSNVYQETTHNSEEVIPTNKYSFTLFPLLRSPDTSSCRILQYKVLLLCDWQFPYQPCFLKHSYNKLRWKGWGWTWHQLHPVLTTIVGLQPPHMEVFTREHYIRSTAPPLNSQCQVRCLHNAQGGLDMEEWKSLLNEGTPYNSQWEVPKSRVFLPDLDICSFSGPRLEKYMWVSQTNTLSLKSSLWLQTTSSFCFFKKHSQ